MKNGTNAAYILRLAGTLLVITALVALALAGVNQITKPLIDAAKAAKTQAAVNEVLPGEAVEVDFTDDTGLVTRAYASTEGYAIQVTPSGFGGEIDMMVGVSKDGKVLGVSIISHAETPSLGAVAAEKGSKGVTFRGQYAGMSGQLAVDKDGGEVDSITSATITTRAVTQGVNAALACAANMG